MTTLFISDLHLDESRPAITQAFYEFLDQRALIADELYILGDFFEVWIGDDEDSTFAAEVSKQLRKLTDNGTELFLMGGNRDFLLGKSFAESIGATLLEDPTVIDLYGERVLLMHGDSLCTLDTEYMAFRVQARSEQFQQGLLSQPLEQRRALAKQLREQSKSMNSLKAEDIMDVTPSEVAKAMDEAQVQVMIHGHTHRPAYHPVELAHEERGERIVLGDWDTDLWWIEACPETALSLNKQAIEPVTVTEEQPSGA